MIDCREEKFKIGDKVVLYKGEYDNSVYTVSGFLNTDTSYVFLRDDNNRIFIEHEDKIDLQGVKKRL